MSVSQNPASLRGDMSRREAADTTSMPWTPSPSPSVWRKRLHLVGGAESGQVTSVVRYDPDSKLGWVNVGEAGGLGFSINDGSFDPPEPGAPTPPIAGSFEAVSSQTAPGVNLLSQAFVVPDNIAVATVSWDSRIENFARIFQDPNQEFRVVIQDVLGTSVFEIFSTDPGDPNLQAGRPLDRPARGASAPREAPIGQKARYRTRPGNVAVE